MSAFQCVVEEVDLCTIYGMLLNQSGTTNAPSHELSPELLAAIILGTVNARATENNHYLPMQEATMVAFVVARQTPCDVNSMAQKVGNVFDIIFKESKGEVKKRLIKGVATLVSTFFFQF
jgi:hypothetical protein